MFYDKQHQLFGISLNGRGNTQSSCHTGCFGSVVSVCHMCMSLQWIHVTVYSCAYVVCVCVHMCIHIIYIRMYLCAFCVHACMCMYVFCACMCMCIYVCVCACVQTWVCRHMLRVWRYSMSMLNSYSFPVSLHSVSALEKRARPLPSVRA